jgi:hypothetical protein
VVKMKFHSYKITLLTRLIKSCYQTNFVWGKTLHFTICLCYLDLDRHSPNHDNFVFFLGLSLWTNNLTNSDGLNILDWI